MTRAPLTFLGTECRPGDILGADISTKYVDHDMGNNSCLNLHLKQEKREMKRSPMHLHPNPFSKEMPTSAGIRNASPWVMKFHQEGMWAFGGT